MSDIIQLLPDSVANQIAAGEVIQRPASVIKELVENAVDADATSIEVLVTDAGRTSIQVIDNGKGMSDTDARLAFERHATSKIRKADDLFALHTMGFRGEALASIAAVAQTELRTRLRGQEVGTVINIAGCKVLSQEPCSCPEGSNFKVDNLFFNVPARRKFLKSNATELGNIITAFERIALVYPNIAFSLKSNGTELFNLKPAGMRQRILDVLGKKINQDLLPIDVNTTLCNISGFVGKPESARKKGVHQYFFVNGRYMKHPYFHKAVMAAYERLVPQGEQVPYFIFFQVEPENIDVNIHPTKTEIKFEDEQSVWQILSAVVKEAVGLFSDIPSIDFDNTPSPDLPAFNRDIETPQPTISYNPNYNPFHTQRRQPSQKSLRHWEQLYDQLPQEEKAERPLFPTGDSVTVPSGATLPDELADHAPIHYQYKGTYIMTAVKSGLMIIDQHRAHIRILYERYLRQIQLRQVSSQKLLFPELLQLPAREQQMLELAEPQLNALGFELTPLGGGSYAINAAPAGIEGLRLDSLILDILHDISEHTTRTENQLQQGTALTLARNAAIPAGQVLGNEEMENLISNLFSCSNVNYTPDGKNILFILRQEDLEQNLGK